MTPSSEKDEVSTALNLLIDTIDEEKKRLNAEGSKAMHGGEYDTAQAVIQFAQRLLAFQDEVAALVEKWKELEDIRDAATPQVQQIVNGLIFSGHGPSSHSKIRQRRSPISADSQLHCLHILAALAAKGGKAKNQDISIAVNRKITMLYPKFSQARALMAQKMWTKKSSSPRVLEISETGRKWLARQQEKISSNAAPATKKSGMDRKADPTGASVKRDNDAIAFESKDYLTFAPGVFALRGERLNADQKGGCTNPPPPGKRDVPNEFRIKANVVVRAGDWIEDEEYGYGKIIKVNSAAVYNDSSDVHELCFFKGNKEMKMTNFQLRKSFIRLASIAEIPESILKRAPSVP